MWTASVIIQKSPNPHVGIAAMVTYTDGNQTYSRGHDNLKSSEQLESLIAQELALVEAYQADDTLLDRDKKTYSFDAGKVLVAMDEVIK